MLKVKLVVIQSQDMTRSVCSEGSGWVGERRDKRFRLGSGFGSAWIRLWGINTQTPAP